MRRDSHRAQNLLNELRSVGQEVTARQLERLGEFGLLGPPDEATGPALVARTREALQLVDEHGSGDKAALIMFVRGYEFDREKLVRAYLTAFDRIEGAIEKAAHPANGYAAAERVASKLANKATKSADQRPIRARLRRMRVGRRFITIRDSLASAYTDVVMIITDGHASSHHSLLELLRALGADAITRDAVPGQPPPVALLPIDAIKQLHKHVRLSDQVAIVGRAGYEQLRTARDDTLAIVNFARVFAPFAGRAFGLIEAFGFAEIAKLNELAVALVIPLMTVVRTIKGPELESLRESIDFHTPRIQAMNELLDAIPKRFYPHAQTIQRIDQLSPGDRAELESVTNEFKTSHPDKFALVITDVKPVATVK